jgi:DNA-binding MarR family transcriptional regulator
MPKKNSDAALTEFIHSVGLLVRRVRAAAASHELSWTESAVLSRLSKYGPATIAELARAESVKPQSMGTTIAALEEQGLVDRTPHPTDGRQVHIQLTTKGASVRQSIGDAKQTWLIRAIGQLNEQDRQTLLRAGEIMTRLVKE